VAPLLQKTFTKMDMALATSAPLETGGRDWTAGSVPHLELALASPGSFGLTADQPE
jgi:hypothetical protein